VTPITLAFSEDLWAELQSWLEDPAEVAGVLLARVIDDDGGTTLLARSLLRAPEEAYLQRHEHGLKLRSTGWVPAIRTAATDDAVGIFVHTHPGGRGVPSNHDDVVDGELREPFVALTGKDIYGSLIIATHEPTVTGRLYRGESAPLLLDRIRIVGDRLTVRSLTLNDAGVTDIHDRQLRALGADGQAVLAGLRVGVVGTGGTGSPVIEQLTRLGVGEVVIIDDDILTPSSIARGYGTTVHDVGQPKVSVIAAAVERIGLDTSVRPVHGNLRNREVVDELRHCDVVFCCVDGHAARIVLNRFAYWHLAPVVDVGVLVSSDGVGIRDIDGRLTWLSPRSACLLCRGRIDPRLAHVENLDPEERRRLVAQGYAPELDEPQPSVITYTTLVAAYAATELLHRLFGLADASPTEMLIQIDERALSLNRRAPRAGCFCSAGESWGQGITEPYLDLTWQS
jgi:molybdopterin/thiamine biosynthesis adenylyltransferase